MLNTTRIQKLKNVDRELNKLMQKWIPVTGWSDEENALIKKYYGKIPARIIAEKLERPIDAIYKKAKIFKLTSTVRKWGKVG